MQLSGIIIGLSLFVLQVLCFTFMPLLWRSVRRPRKKICLEEIWIALVLNTSLQAITGTLWSSLRLSYPPAAQLLFFLTAGLLIGEGLYRYPPPSRALQSRRWMGVVLTIALFARLIPASLQSSLGQSDAYCHLQFGMEILTSSHLSHPLYPVGHAWVHILPALIFNLDPYTLYRYGGAFYGVAMVLGVFFVCRRAFSERAATCAALMAAGFPLLLPLIKTGVGVYANQFGLMLIPFLLWALPRRFYLSVPAFIALAVSIPMMMLDLLPVVFIFLLLNSSYKRLGFILLIGSGGVGLIYWKLLQLPPEHLHATFYMLSAEESVQTLPQLLRHYLQWKPVAISLPTQIAVAFITLSATALLCLPGCRKPKTILLILLCSFCGFQSFSGCFQFANYQRAGWLFLLGLAMVSGGIGWRIARHLHLQSWARPLLVLSCAGLWFFPPVNRPHLSASENELVDFLRSLPRDSQGDIWSRPFNNFSGGQGDPVRVLLHNHKNLNIRQIQKNEFPRINTRITNWIIIDTEPLPSTRESFHEQQVHTLWQRNQRLQLAVEQFPPHEIELYQQGSLRVWKITPGEEVR